jgi:NADH-quinone oxidoreductase subunit F
MDYPSMKSRAKRDWKALQKRQEPLIYIGMGTCGRAAGAEEVHATVIQTLTEMNLPGHVLQVGCIGTCYLEPLMAVRKPGSPFVYYGNLTAARTKEILSTYLRDGTYQGKWAVCTMGEGSVDGLPRFDELPMIPKNGLPCAIAA